MAGAGWLLALCVTTIAISWVAGGAGFRCTFTAVSGYESLLAKTTVSRVAEESVARTENIQQCCHWCALQLPSCSSVRYISATRECHASGSAVTPGEGVVLQGFCVVTDSRPLTNSTAPSSSILANTNYLPNGHMTEILGEGTSSESITSSMLITPSSMPAHVSTEQSQTFSIASATTLASNHIAPVTLQDASSLHSYISPTIHQDESLPSAGVTGFENVNVQEASTMSSSQESGTASGSYATVGKIINTVQPENSYVIGIPATDNGTLAHVPELPNSTVTLYQLLNNRVPFTHLRVINGSIVSETLLVNSTELLPLLEISDIEMKWITKNEIPVALLYSQLGIAILQIELPSPFDTCELLDVHLPCPLARVTVNQGNLYSKQQLSQGNFTVQRIDQQLSINRFEVYAYSSNYGCNATTWSGDTITVTNATLAADNNNVFSASRLAQNSVDTAATRG